jgi:hypothetical protein
MESRSRLPLHLLSPADDSLRAAESYRAADLVRLAEVEASKIRSVAGLDEHQRFQPWSVAGRLEVVFTTLDELEGLGTSDRELISHLEPKTWSGAGLPLPDGRTLIILNPRQTPERATVTVVEEMAHVHFRHTPSRLEQLPNGLVRREYDRRAELEAYWTAAAVLLPSAVVAKAVWHRTPIENLASDYGVSTQLAEFRIKVLCLWKLYMTSRGGSRS